MESKIKKTYLVKWYDMIVQGVSADIECDIEKIEEKFNIESSLFYTSKLRSDEMVVNKILLNEIKSAVQRPLSMAEENYKILMKSHGFDLKKLEEELAQRLKENIHSEKEVIPEEEKDPSSGLRQLSLF
ncbi:hypothetical protein QTG56_22530 (plasmid) [Rossellomorea sp. AcN35-11]|nr:hypothetical protein [Rossellomorea aquimaris]WJV32150.1 hypothetical protein QTG56_22530 [Rossellomorea sp. AcN35-11]